MQVGIVNDKIYVQGTLWSKGLDLNYLLAKYYFECRNVAKEVEKQTGVVADELIRCVNAMESLSVNDDTDFPIVFENKKDLYLLMYYYVSTVSMPDLAEFCKPRGLEINIRHLIGNTYVDSLMRKLTGVADSSFLSTQQDLYFKRFDELIKAMFTNKDIFNTMRRGMIPYMLGDMPRSITDMLVRYKDYANPANTLFLLIRYFEEGMKDKNIWYDYLEQLAKLKESTDGTC
jgi:hypothetical protein